MDDLPRPTRRTLLGASGAALAASSSSDWSGAASAPQRYDVNVRHFGAVGDGSTDDTAAFNRATDAAAPWSPALERRIIVPPGRYRLTGTVYVRKGQDVAGSGYATQIDARGVAQSTFVLGRAQGTEEDDPGGSPVRLHGFRALGSAPRAPFILVRALGFSIEDLFLTAMGTAILVRGVDGVISNVIIDQALNGIVFDRAQNVIVSGLYTYLANYALTFLSDCADIQIANAVIAYNRHAGVLFAEQAQRLRGLGFSGCSFLQNEQFKTFSGFVQARATSMDAMFTGCSFRNWPGFAIEQGAGHDVILSFSGCVFDGRRTNETYNQSDTAAVLTTGVGGRYRFTGCEFRNLSGPIGRLRPLASELAVEGGGAIACRQPLFVIEAADPPLSVRGLAGMAQQVGSAQDPRFALPSWPGASWRLTGRCTGRDGKTVVQELFATDQGKPEPVLQPLLAPATALRVSVRPSPRRALEVEGDRANGWTLAALEASTA